MVAEVVALTDNVRLPDRPDADMVEIAQEILRMAEAGEIIGIAYATVDPVGRPSTGWATKSQDAFVLIGGVSRLLWRLHQESI